MNLEQYVNDANRTVSDGFYGENVSIEHFFDTMLEFEEAGTMLDAQKKALFYNKANMNYGVEDCTQLVETTVSVNNLHGIIGVATEATELVQLLLKSSAYDSLDTVNLSEEIGDIMWYIALLCKENGFSLENIMQQNITKLKLRYPEKFTNVNANVRNLDAERELLENTTNV